LAAPLIIAETAATESDIMLPQKLTELPWRELPLVIILGLLIGGAFGQLTKLIVSEPISVITKEKR
jgi:hypothetical protein